mgnify:CR=1 FL=1
MKKHLKGVEFSIWSGEDIKKQDVCHVFEKRTSDKGILLENGLRDPKMGPMKGNQQRPPFYSCNNCILERGLQCENGSYSIARFQTVVVCRPLKPQKKMGNHVPKLSEVLRFHVANRTGANGGYFLR